ncbi:SDR family NAD(P)-dependent oxidoreductase [Labedaea rhizosphaerae]|uniref:Short-subunit dehydrogenase n=1 Tax=Labedaea rhizosphaerae TaxID=598644 RepID=A0A4V3CZS1_LABRH|nr:SDR family NAD(P)-dependent oxidoreductase [Labedaea rhizosphaerae]TDQ00831.1 short-subunit dehydrogenase [Labedaea rhizosphaerae]
MSKSIAVFGAGPALGASVARRYAKEGYTVVLVARDRERLDELAAELGGAHAIAADLSDLDGLPALAGQVRDLVGELDTLYYGACSGGFTPATDLTAERLRAFLPLSVDALVALVHEFLPSMLDRHDGAILTAQGVSAVRGMPYISGPGPALAAQRNYLQSLRAEVAGQGVHVGGLYIGAAIEKSPFHAAHVAAKAAGEPVPDLAIADPDELAELVWTMQATRRPEVIHPEGLLG